MRLKIGLYDRDKTLLENISSYIGYGTISLNEKNNSCYISVFSLQHHLDILIPLFDNNTVEGVKTQYYKDLRKVAYLMKYGYHKTLDELKEIQGIKSGINTKRIFILVDG